MAGSLPCPDETTYPAANWVWQQNDISLRSFLLQHISPADYSIVQNLPTSRATFEALRNRHENLGPNAQVLLLATQLPR
ncbi:hypothetical protein BC826DRAFT_90965 [Russula brevipes]|nr:hypothetical protein BC826DRAFT_90965 [Russula brevipes]